MGFFDKNLGEKESLMRIAAGFIVSCMGVIVFILNAWGAVFVFTGLLAFGEGYHRWSLLRALGVGRK